MSLLQLLTTLAAAVTLVAAQSTSLTVNTPTSAQTCLPVQISWGGGTPPYYVSLIPGGQPGGQIIKDFGEQNSNSLTWNVDQAAGTVVSVQIRDSTGAINYSDKVTVQASTKSCANGSSNSSGTTSTSTPSKSGTTAGSTPPTSSNGPSNTTTSSNSGSTTPSSSPAPAVGGSAAVTAASASGASHIIPGFVLSVSAAVLAIFL